MNVIIPVEILVRELNGRLWMALHIVNKGHDVLIGKTPSIHQAVDVFDADIAFTEGAARFVPQYNNAGVKTVYLDQEGGVFRTKDSYRDRIQRQAIGEHDLIFSWGERQKEIAHAAGHETAVVSGNPRFDLLHSDLREIYRPTSRRLQETYGNFILFNTNFARGNPVNGNFKSDGISASSVSDRDSADLFLCTQFIEVIEHLADNIDKTIIIRPHPSENHDTYISTFSDNPQVRVIHEGSVRPWIMAADAVIHNGCTTGIEAAMMNTPVYTYMPKGIDDYRSPLPNEVSTNVTSQQELVAQIKSVSNHYSMSEKQRQTLKQYFHNVDEKSAPIIADAIDDLDSDRDKPFTPTFREQIKRKFVRVIGDKNVTRLRTSGIMDHWEISNQKFPYIPTDSIRKRVDYLSEFLDGAKIQTHRVNDIENGFILTQ